MQYQALLKMLCEHEFTKEEKEHMQHITGIMQREGILYVSCGCPLYKCDPKENKLGYQAGAENYTSVVAIKNKDEQSFSYYTIEIYDRGNFYAMDFQDIWLSKLKNQVLVECGLNADPLECYLYYLLGVTIAEYHRKHKGSSYMLYQGKCCRNQSGDINPVNVPDKGE